MTERSAPASSGITFAGALGISFIVLKLAGHIDDWPWWLVLSPIWGPPSLVIAGLLVFALAWSLVTGAAMVFELLKKKARKRVSK